MIGHVDQERRALLPVSVRGEIKSHSTVVEVWIDTAFDGHLVFSSELIKSLSLESLVETEAVLADGSTVKHQTFPAYLDWFEETIPVQAVENEGRFPLLGTGLLEMRCLTIDYLGKHVELT